MRKKHEDILLGNVSTDPYRDYFYSHKYFDALGDEVTGFESVIESWIEKKRDWKPAPKALQKTWSTPEKDDVVEDQEYLYTSSSHLRSINNVVFKNFSKNNQADLFGKFLKDQCDKDFTVLKPVKGRRFRHKYILDPIKMEPWIYTKYPPPNTEKSVLVHMRVADDTLKYFKRWYFDELSFGAVIFQHSDYFFILESMDLLNFGSTDMTVLFQNPIKVASGYDQERSHSQG
ncbi:hypothetical protein R6Q57_013248 [Mikania cordata]